MAIVKNQNSTEAVDTTDADQQLQIPNDLPVLPLRDIVIYPFMIVPLFVSRRNSIRAVDEALGEKQNDPSSPRRRDLDKEEPTADDLYIRWYSRRHHANAEVADGRIRILVQGLARARIESVDPSGEYLRSRVNVIQEILAARTFSRSGGARPRTSVVPWRRPSIWVRTSRRK